MSGIVLAGFYVVFCLGVTFGFIACAVLAGTDCDDIPDPPRGGHQPKPYDGPTNPPPRRP